MNILRLYIRIENRVLRSGLGPVRDGLTNCWKKLHNEEVGNLQSSLVIFGWSN
jgi:hypothetical protein